MRSTPFIRHLAAACLLPLAAAGAAVAPVEIRVPETTAWTGQRLKVYVELRSKGSFSGAPSFSLPRIPRAMLVKLGSPVVSSRDIEGESHFVQTHEFALFSQQSGTVEIPAFEVRFSSREGFSGEAGEIRALTQARKVEIRRPPGSEGLGFLVTTPRLEISETWDPPPGPAKIGDLFKRTIVQKADQVTGMALAPAPSRAPAGFRIYPKHPEISDNTERGDFSAERSDTLTYVAREPGDLLIPAIRYDWWNPESERLESKTLPAVRLAVAAPPAPPPPRSPARFLWLLIAAALIASALLFRKAALAFARRLRDRIDPPPRRAARAFLAACRRGDPAAAGHAWDRWQGLHAAFEPPGDLRARVMEMRRSLYGPPGAGASWSGRELARAFRRAMASRAAPARASALPPLNASDSAATR